MTRLRSLRIRHLVLPFVLGALALRAFMPAGAMPDREGRVSVDSQMCSSRDAGKSETVELPGKPVGPHCEYCGLPPLGVPFAQSLRIPDARPDAPIAVTSTQVLDLSPSRPATARGPPFA